MSAESGPCQAHRIVLEPAEVRGLDVLLSPANSHHVREVLRLRHGGSLRGLVPRDATGVGSPPGGAAIGGYDLLLRIEDSWEGRLHCSVQGRIDLATEPQLAVTVCQSLTRGERFEYTLQKCTEIGATGFVPLLTERTVVRRDAVHQGQRMQRWRRIVEEAALQSGRALIPVVSEPVSLPEFLSRAMDGGADVRLVADEAERTPLRAVAEGLRRQCMFPRTAQVVVGPEGGLGRAEIDRLQAAGFTPVSLGPRILRTETAGPVLTALLLYEFADLGGSNG